MFINEIKDVKYDVAIVGAGPAGLTLAMSLAEHKGCKILIVESGGLATNESISLLSAVEAEGDLSSDYYPRHAQRVFGGGSTVWVGYCATMQKRAFMNGKWPLSYEELNRFYPQAANILELPEESYLSQPVSVGVGDNLVYKPFHLSPPVRFDEKYLEYFSAHPMIDVLLEKTCVSINKDNNSVDLLEIKNSSGDSDFNEKIFAQNYVLACGGLGNPRLLQSSGIGASLPVGKYFTEHPHIHWNYGSLMLDKELIDSVLVSGNVDHALHFSDDFCIDNNLLNYSISFYLDSIGEEFILGIKRPVYYSNATLRAEMELDRSNRVIPGRGKDGFGNSLPNVNFYFNYENIAKESWKHFSTQLLVSGVGRATAVREVSPQIMGGGHFMCTTRMGEDCESSVVDSNCKVHGIDNLYIAGSSVFPAAGAANPTFTIVALALRLAEHLKKQLKDK